MPPDKDDELEPPPPPIKLTGDSSLHRAEDNSSGRWEPLNGGMPSRRRGLNKGIFVFVLVTSAFIVYIALRVLGIL
jgi:hypothetical protein